MTRPFPGSYTPPSHPMMTELVMVKEVGIFTNGIMFINLYVPDTVTVTMITRGQVVDRGGDTLVGSAHGHGEVAETRGLARHVFGHGRLNVRADRGTRVVGDGVTATFPGSVVEQVPVHEEPGKLENAKYHRCHEDHDQGGLNRHGYRVVGRSRSLRITMVRPPHRAARPYWAGRSGAIWNGVSINDVQTTVTWSRLMPPIGIKVLHPMLAKGT